MQLTRLWSVALLLFLASCGFSQPEYSAASGGNIDVTAGRVSPIRKGYPSNEVSILAQSQPLAVSAQLLTSSRTLPAARGPGSGTIFQWQVVVDACKDLPQGQNIVLTFNQYNTQGQLLISEQATLPSVNAC